jgi:hypothetical protein
MTTKADIYLSAVTFAAGSVSTTDAVELATAEIAAFKAVGFDSADLQQFQQFSAQARQQLKYLSAQPAASEQAKAKPQPAKAPSITNAAAAQVTPEPAQVAETTPTT